MQSIQVENIRGLERDAFKRDHYHQRPGIERDRRHVDMADIGDEGLRTEFARSECGQARQIRGPFHRISGRASGD
ncbi:hypothetical protein D3C71_1994280 [compost metagenome]